MFCFGYVCAASLNQTPLLGNSTLLKVTHKVSKSLVSIPGTNPKQRSITGTTVLATVYFYNCNM